MLSNKEIISLAPSAAATTPSAHCSDKYTLVPTMSMVEVLRKEGFVPVAARQDKVRPDRWQRELHARHMITLRAKSTAHMSPTATRLGAVPEILMLNSSDGSCPFQLKLGLLRLICSNGMVVFSEVMPGVNRVHKAITAESVIAQAQALSANSKPLFDKIEKWTKIKLNDHAQRKFAREVLKLRIGEERAKHYDVEEVLRVRRPEDEAPTLWNIMNRAQEASMRGLITGTQVSATGVSRPLRMRPLNGISADVEFNQQLWALTELWASFANK